MLHSAVPIPFGKSAPAYAYRDARRGSVDGEPELGAWAEGQISSGDVLELLNERWYGAVELEEASEESVQRSKGTSLASVSSRPAYDSSSSSIESRSRFCRASDSLDSSLQSHSSPAKGLQGSLNTFQSAHSQTNNCTVAPSQPHHFVQPSADKGDFHKALWYSPHSQIVQQPSNQHSLLAALGTWTKRIAFFHSHAKQAKSQPFMHVVLSRSQTADRARAPDQHPATPLKSPVHRPVPARAASWKQSKSVSPFSSHGASAASAPMPARPPAEHVAQPFGSAQTSEDDEDTNQAAWRWRFNRRWAREQARHPQMQAADDDEDDVNWDDALGYMDACGRPGWQLQIARTSSHDGTRASQQSEPSHLLLEASSMPEGELTAQADLDSSEATKQVIAMARRAQHLQQQQSLLETQAQQRWAAATFKPAWVGSRLLAVRADHFGSYLFILVRLSSCPEQCSGNYHQQHKVILRGKAGLSESSLMEALNKEVVRTMATHHLPKVGLHLLGSGNLHWGCGQDLGVHIVPGRVTAGRDKDAATLASFAQRGSDLLKASLPPHFQVTIGTAG